MPAEHWIDSRRLFSLLDWPPAGEASGRRDNKNVTHGRVVVVFFLWSGWGVQVRIILIDGEQVLLYN